MRIKRGRSSEFRLMDSSYRFWWQAVVFFCIRWWRAICCRIVVHRFLSISRGGFLCIKNCSSVWLFLQRILPRHGQLWIWCRRNVRTTPFEMRFETLAVVLSWICILHTLCLVYTVCIFGVLRVSDLFQLASLVVFSHGVLAEEVIFDAIYDRLQCQALSLQEWHRSVWKTIEVLGDKGWRIFI